MINSLDPLTSMSAEVDVFTDMLVGEHETAALRALADFADFVRDHGGEARLAVSQGKFDDSRFFTLQVVS